MTCSGNDVLIGTAPSVEVTFRDADNALVDPTSIVVTTRSPSDVQTTYTSPTAEIVQSSTGVWVFTFPAALDERGKWWVRWDATGGVTVSTESSIQVRSSQVPV